jgi:hypothetical protein
MDLTMAGRPDEAAAVFANLPELFGKDVQVARLDAGGTVEDVISWMDANQATGLVSTANDQAPATFVGGVHDKPLGSTAHFPLTIERGNHVRISELPSANPD